MRCGYLQIILQLVVLLTTVIISSVAIHVLANTAGHMIVLATLTMASSDAANAGHAGQQEVETTTQ